MPHTSTGARSTEYHWLYVNWEALLFRVRHLLQSVKAFEAEEADFICDEGSMDEELLD